MLYVYGLREGGASDEALQGFDGAPISWLLGQGWAAATATVAARPEASAANLSSHDQTARRAAAGATAFLPARFGQVFADEPSLAEAIQRREASVREALAGARGCVQMTLRLFGAAAPLAPETEPTAGLGPGARFLAARRAAAAPPPEVATLRHLLGDLVVAEHWQKSAASGLIGTVCHLVPAHALEAYRRALPRGPLGSVRTVHSSGPWLPYAFAPDFDPSAAP